MARYLLDSDSVIDWLNNVPASVSLIERLDTQGDLLCLCAVVVAEAFSGLPSDNSGPAEALLDGLAFLPTTP